MAAEAAAAADRLRRILQVEQIRGCTDATVIGGIDALLRNLLAQENGVPGSPVENTIQALAGKAYGKLDVPARRSWVDRALRLLAQSGPPVHRNTLPPDRRVSPPIRRAPPATSTPVRVQTGAVAAPDHDMGAAAPLPAPTPPHTAPKAPAVARKTGKPITLDSVVVDLTGVGATRAAILARLGIERVRDLIYHFPHRHDDFSRVVHVAELANDVQQTIVTRVWSAAAIVIGKSFRKSTELIVGDETGNLRVIFFNNPYPAASLHTNQRVVLSGKVSLFQGQRQLENPEWEVIEEGSDLDRSIHTGRLVPVYPLTQGIQNRALRGYIRMALDLAGQQLIDPMSAERRQQYGYIDLITAIRQAHYPDSQEALEAARRRLAYDELFTLQLSVLARRARRVAVTRAMSLPLSGATGDAFLASLPFALTAAQRRCTDAILADLERETPAARLLQGDVGSGKTVVAASALLAAASNGRQAVLMAPTEILAEQHFRTLCRLFGGGEPDEGATVVECRPAWLDRPLVVAMLRGSLKAAAKREAQVAIAAGRVDIAVGTQALIQSGVAFARLGLTVVDEQHRFGVMQRSALTEKGESSHLLVMTATPIPRTLALSLYGDLDISVIDEMPSGRKTVRTRIVTPSQRDFSYRFVRNQLEQGFQAFVICPLVEESELLEVRAATEEYERLRSEVFPDRSVSLLHGRMAPTEKDAVMRGFRDRSADILVSTAVVEVGIDIPRATVIMIEGADRFGLAQLHQFRGRVGRGGAQSYCLLLSDNPSSDARQRLKLLEEIDDGFQLAEADLRLRGPGDYFGTRQSGLPTLRQARLTDTPILEAAREDAAQLIQADPELLAPHLTETRRRVQDLAERAGEAN